MPDTLRSRRILVAEDEYLLAEELRRQLEGLGAVVVGPVATVDQVLDLIATEPPVDVAVLDVNLRGEKVFPAVDLLVGRGVPVVLATGYDATEFPARWPGVRWCQKPISLKALARVVGEALAG